MKNNLLNITLALSASLLVGCATPTGTTSGVDPNYDAAGKRKAVIVKQTDRGVQITSDERILFDTGKADIKGDGQVFVQRVATILKEKTQANVLVEGHTDNVGTPQANQALSTQRANAVRSALIANGVAATRIQAQGFGLTKPVGSNDTPEARQANRRTEIIVLGATVAQVSGGAGGGGGGLADQLSAGIDKFLQDSVNLMKSVFGVGDKK